MGPKPDESSACAKALPAELPDIQLAARSPHFGVAGIADLRVVRPDQDLRLGPARDKDPLQRVKHVPVAPIPGFVRAVVHDPTISFSIAAALVFDSSDTVAATALSLGQLVIAGRVIRAGKSKRLPQRRASGSTICGWKRRARRGWHGSGANGGGAQQMMQAILFQPNPNRQLSQLSSNPSAFLEPIPRLSGRRYISKAFASILLTGTTSPSPRSGGANRSKVGLADRVAAANTVSELRGFGFIGMISHGIHHQEHHLMFARHKSPPVDITEAFCASARHPWLLDNEERGRFPVHQN